MINYKHSALFTKNSVDKQLTIKTDDESVVITNLELNQENFELTESICSESELKFGCCEASSVKFRISDVRTSLKEKWLTITEVLDENSDTPFQFGRYKVFSDKSTADKRYRDVVAYDAMFDIINADVADWYNTILPTVDSTVTMKEFRTSFIAYFRLEQEDIELANDNMIVEKTIDALQISGKDVISAICELNGCFGHIGRDGKFKYILLTKKEDELYPADDLYPSDDLYIPQSNAINLGNKNYISCEYEDYISSKITKLQIRQEESDTGAIVGDDGNCYVVEDNFLVYGKSADELEEIATNLLGVIEGICFRPFSADLKGNPCYEVGDYIRFRTKYRIVESYILKRTLSGIQALRDTFEADGEEYYTEKVNSVQKSIIQLKEKTNKLTRNVNETKSELSSLETDIKDNYSTTTQMNSAITQTAESINNSVSKQITETVEHAEKVADNAESNANARTDEKLKSYSTTTEMNSAIEQKASSITSTVSQSQTKWLVDLEQFDVIDIYGYGPPASDLAISYDMQYLDMKTGEVYQTITNGEGRVVWTIIGQCEKRIDDIYSKIEQNAEGISQKVGYGEVVSEINQTADTIELKGDRIIVESTKWKVNEDGSQECSDMKITGGSVQLTGEETADTKFIVKNSKTGHHWDMSPGFFRYYDKNDVMLVNFYPLLSQLILKDTQGGEAYISPIGMHTDGSASAGRIALGADGSYAPLLYVNGDAQILGPLTVTGTKSRLAETEDYGERLLYCYETPSPMFGDLGEGQIDETGKCYIFLDDIFGETIDTDCMYQVFLQPYGKGECYVTERTSSYFIVEGTENLAFGWELKAIQRDFDTMRLEEYEEPETEESTIGETEAYLNSLVYGEDTVADTEEYLDSLVYYEESEEDV